MEDHNMIACLYPVGTDKHAITTGRALHTIRMRENQAYYFSQPPRSLKARQEAPDIQNLERGQGEKRGAEQDVEEYGRCLYTEGIQLRFDQQRKNRHGFLIGSHANCDIVLPAEPGLSSVGEYQCLITFDHYGRLILRDVRDPATARPQEGTIVTYDGEGKDSRCGFTWILSGERFTEKRMEIWFRQRIGFLVDVAPHDVHSVDYLDKIVRFRERETVLLDDLPFHSGFEMDDVLCSTSLVATDQPLLLGGRPIFLDDVQIGDGGQAVVKRVWDVSTGLQYASKEPIGIKEKHWRCFNREAEMIQQLRHSNIIKCIFITEVPKRRAILEYLPLGSLHDQAKKQRISSSENLQVLTQGLAALCFLHHRDKPIAHRDIKPENILVRSRDTAALHVKLSDFGLSKRRPQVLKTYCGTERYMAPEVESQETYDEAVDIWSLGLVALQYAHGFPSSKVMTGRFWAERITEYLKGMVEAEKCPLLGFLEQHMLLIDPEERSWARRCAVAASKLEAPGCCAQRTITQTVSDLNSDDDDDNDLTFTHIPDSQGPQEGAENLRLTVAERGDEKTVSQEHTTGIDTLAQVNFAHEQTKVETTATQTLTPTTPQRPQQAKTRTKSTASTIRASKQLGPASTAPFPPMPPPISRKRRHTKPDTSTPVKRCKLATMRKRGISSTFQSKGRCTRSTGEMSGTSLWVLPMPKLALEVSKEMDFRKRFLGATVHDTTFDVVVRNPQGVIHGELVMFNFVANSS